MWLLGQKGKYVWSYARQAIDVNFKGINIQTTRAKKYILKTNFNMKFTFYDHMGCIKQAGAQYNSQQKFDEISI